MAPQTFPAAGAPATGGAEAFAAADRVAGASPDGVAGAAPAPVGRHGAQGTAVAWTGTVGGHPAAAFANMPAWLNLPEPRGFRPKRKYRTVWISDVHLGTRGCNAEMLVDFLRSFEAETLYLVGDIVDGWRLRKGWYWPDAHNEVVRRVLKMAHRGTRVVFVAGNHDEMLREFAGMTFGGVELVLEAVHLTADGRRLLVTHGDSFDAVVLYHKWLAYFGDKAYSAMMRVNIAFNAVRRRMKLPYWSLSAYLKKRVKNAVQYICSFEDAVAHEAEARGLDGIVCGHIHSAEIRTIGNITYYNDGDWVESCTALVEDAFGRISIVDWLAETGGHLAPPGPIEVLAEDAQDEAHAAMGDAGPGHGAGREVVA